MSTMVSTLDAERIKLATTRSPLWSAVVLVVLSLGFAAIVASAASYEGAPLQPERAAIGVAVFGVPVLMILAAMTITGEYRTGMIRTTYMANPNRTLVLVSKALVVALFSAVIASLMVLLSILVARGVASPSSGELLSLSHTESWRAVTAIGLYAALAAVLALGLGAILRHAAGVITILLLLPFVVEPLLTALPNVGPKVGPLLPFANAFEFIGVPWVQVYEMHWGPVGSLLYFTAITAVVFAAAVVAVNRRDP